MNIDPNIQNIMLGLISNGLTSLIAITSKKAGNQLIGKEFLEEWELEKTSLSPLLTKATVKVAESVEWKRAKGEEVISLFLLSPEIEDLVRQIYSLQITNLENRAGINSIYDIFHSLFCQFVSSYPSEIILNEVELVSTTNLLFNALVNGCNSYLKNAIDQGVLAAHEAQSVFRHNIIHSEISAIQKKIDFLVAHQQLNIHAILDFEKKYRLQLEDRHGNIIPPNFDSARKLPISKIYVFPDFAQMPIDKKKRTLDVNTFLSSIYRVVLIGNPGAGKSTLTLKLCHDLAAQDSQRLVSGRKQATPILVVLRNYGIQKKEHRCSLKEFIEIEVEATYQLSIPPEGAFEYLFLNGRAIVIFDGLDELLDTSHRQEIRDDIQSFCNLYPSIPVLVTSREVGYEQAPLDETLFEVFRLEPFNENQIEEYATKWFAIADADLSSKQIQQKVAAFLRESQNITDLRSNPLMLALMCNIYKGENYIPRNRPDVYEKCAVMLFDRWDKSRNIHFSLPFEAHLRPTMMYLAHWIYTTEVLRAGVTEKRLIKESANYLHRKRFEDLDEAERSAQDFIGFCRDRAWVFTDTGTERDGERLYQFTHQTFLEYFTAAYLVRTHPTPEDLVTILKPKITNEEWDIVCQLSFQILNKNFEDAGDVVLSSLIDYSSSLENHQWINVSQFIMRCLNFIIPSPRVLKNIIDTSLPHIISIGTKYLEANVVDKVPSISEIYRIALPLEDIADENIATFIKHSTYFILEFCKHGSMNEVVAALETLDMLKVYSRVSSLWKEAEKQIYTNLEGRLDEIYLKSIYLYINHTNSEDYTYMIKNYGIQFFFRDIFNIFGCIGHGAFIRKILEIPYMSKGEIKKSKALNSLKVLGQMILSDSSLYKQKISVESYHGTLITPSGKRTKVTLNLDKDETFGLLIICFYMLELNEEIDHSMNINLIQKAKYILFIHFRHIFLARFAFVEKEQIQKEIDKISFSYEQQNFIWRWLNKEINLIESNINDSKDRIWLYQTRI